MTWPETFDITLNTETVVGIALLTVVSVAIPFVFGAITAKQKPDDPDKSLLERVGLAQVNPGILLLGAVLWGLIFIHLYLGLIWMIWEVWSSDAPITGQTGDWRFTLAKFTALTAVLGAVVAFPVTVVRLGLTRQQTRTAEDALFNDKINEAARSLYATRVISKQVEDPQAGVIWRDMHEDDIVRRNAAIDALEELARDRPAEAVRISRMLSVYVRELSREFPGEEVPEGMGPVDLWGWALGLRTKRSDMYSAVLTLGRMRLRHSAVFAAERIDLRGANLQGMTLTAETLSFEGTLFEQAVMQGANLRGAGLQGANLSRAELQGANLIGAELQGASLRGAELQGADLIAAELQGANLRGAELQGASLRGAELQGTDLTRAEFDAATNLTATLLHFGAVRFVDFTDVALSQDQIDTMFGDQTVTLPVGITRPAHWVEVDKFDWWTFDDKWRAWQAEHGFDPNDPATWNVAPFK